MEKQKKSGGARQGAGRPKSITEKKKVTAISLYPVQREILIQRFGSVQKAVDSLLSGQI